MMINHVKELDKVYFKGTTTKNASMKVLVSGAEGWNNHVMRELELGVDGYSPKHSHPWPHINYILEGFGEIEIDGKVVEVTKGSYAFIPGNTLHQFRNIGKEVFKFICIVPTEGHIY
jgi:quercetin dioxygenase-like cupin family protein